MNTTVGLRRRPWRLLCGGLILAVLAGAAYAGFSLLLAPQRVAELLAQEVSEVSGWQFSVRGSLSYQFLPRLALVAKDVALANAPWGSKPQLLHARRLAIDLALWPLLRGRVHAGTFSVDGLDVLLEIGNDGIGN